MSLSLEKTSNGIPIATSNENGIDELIYYVDRDDLPEGAKLLERIRLNQPEDYFFPLIKDYKNEEANNIYISGPSGVGKTLFIRSYIKHFLKKYPKAKILLFSSKTKDKNIDDIKSVQRIRIDDDMIINPMTLSEISSKSTPVMTVFDDIEDFQNKKLNIEINRLCNEVIRNGRANHIFNLYVNHDPCDYNKTKLFLKEATQVVMLPYRAPKTTYNLIMEKYLKLDKKTQNQLINLKSKYVVVNRGRPEFVLSDKYIMLI
ncbi:MAG: hypothetical protein KGZ34_04475 [Nitrosarchaeum sp.]|nr:hypothetical protein [Nitrosarchaeum sp.]